MNIDLSAPFAESTCAVISTMAMLDCNVGSAHLKRGVHKGSDITGLIGLAGGQTRGVFSISFPKAVIFDITKRMLGDEVKEIDSTVTDMVGEVTNMISGHARQKLSEQNYELNMALPLVIIGDDHFLLNKSRGVMVVPISTAAGEFFVEVCFEETYT